MLMKDSLLKINVTFLIAGLNAVATKAQRTEKFNIQA
jgi:hypothetical protein